MRPREVYIFTEGEVTEPSYIDLVRRFGTRVDPSRPVTVSLPSVPSSRRKPFPLVEAAALKRRDAESAASQAGLNDCDWNWPQVWCLFDRDQHAQIPSAFALAEEERVRIAYSHPCFELWRLLHYQNYTATLGGVGHHAADRLRRQPGFAQTYGKKASVGMQTLKTVRWEQLQGRYDQAQTFAKQVSERHVGTDPTSWDPFTDVWRFVKDGLGIASY